MVLPRFHRNARKVPNHNGGKNLKSWISKTVNFPIGKFLLFAHFFMKILLDFFALNLRKYLPKTKNKERYIEKKRPPLFS